jgi:WD40 repeat protein
VFSVCFSPDGKHIASGSGDKTVRIWDVETGEMVQEPLQGHGDSVGSVCFSPDGKHIASGSGDKTVRIWDVETGEMVQESLQGNSGKLVQPACFSPNSKHGVSESGDGPVETCDPKLQNEYKACHTFQHCASNIQDLRYTSHYNF